MSSPSSLNYTFRTRADDFASQVSCDQDPKFWFRLEIKENYDLITDFFLGAFDPALGGELLTASYKKLSRQPPARVVFGDILSSKSGDAAAVESAKAILIDYAMRMFASFGRKVRGTRVEMRRNKFDLMIET